MKRIDVKIFLAAIVVWTFFALLVGPSILPTESYSGAWWGAIFVAIYGPIVSGKILLFGTSFNPGFTRYLFVRELFISPYWFVPIFYWLFSIFVAKMKKK